MENVQVDIDVKYERDITPEGCQEIGFHPIFDINMGYIPRFSLRSYYLVCIKNNLLFVGIGPVLNKELKFIYHSDRSDCTYFVVRYKNIIYDKFYI